MKYKTQRVAARLEQKEYKELLKFMRKNNLDTSKAIRHCINNTIKGKSNENN